jgi:hypothetical protein
MPATPAIAPNATNTHPRTLSAVGVLVVGIEFLMAIFGITMRNAIPIAIVSINLNMN